MWVLGALLASAIFGIGYTKFLQLKHRKMFFEDFLFFLDGAKTQVMFFQNKLAELFENNKYKNDFTLFLKNSKEFILTENKTKFLLYLNSVQFFESTEHNFVVNFFENFGKTDSESQCETILKFSDFISFKLKTEREKFKQKGKITLSLSAMLGLFAFIVIW